MSIFNRFRRKPDDAPCEAAADEVSFESYTEEEIEEFGACVESCFGNFEHVLHEMYSPDIHVDVIIVPPTENEPYYKLVTMGMGAHKMNVPPELLGRELEYAELVIFLPPDWDIASNDEKYYWPIRCLKMAARLPIQNDTWLAVGHTMQLGDLAQPFVEGADIAGIIFLNALDKKCKPINLRLSSGKKINFYQVMPLFYDELQYKLTHSAADLCRRFAQDDLFPIVNLERKNYGKVK